MKKCHLFIIGLFLFTACASIPERQPASSVEKTADTDNDIIVQEIKQAVNIEGLEDRLYQDAYESYLSGKYENAIASFETAKIINPEKMVFWKSVALNYCYIATGKYKDAEKLAEQLMSEKPDFWRSYLNAGLAALWQNKIAKSIRFLEMADDFDAHEPMVNLYLGMAYKLAKNKVESQKHFKTADLAYREIISKNPNNEQSLVELAYMNLYRNVNLQESIKFIEQASDIIKESDELQQRQVWLDYYLRHLKGIYYYRAGNYQQSILVFGAAIQKAPSGIRIDLAETYYYLGKNYQALKSPKKTRMFFEHALKLDPLVMYAQDVHRYLKPSS